MIDIVLYIGIGLIMVVALIMGIMYEYGMGEILKKENTLKQNAVRREKWKRLKRKNNRI